MNNIIATKVILPMTKFKKNSQFINKKIPAKNGPKYVIHDGPPYCSGQLHLGHALNKIIKDITLRYRLLRGNNVYMRPGFDTHGLPVELRARTKASLPIDIRHEACLYAMSSLKTQLLQFQSWNIIADWDNPYKTMDNSYVVKQLQIFHQLYKSGLVYREYKPVYWSPANKTALAEAEIEYNLITSKSIFCKLKIRDKLFLLVWTTTPYTVPSNNAVCVSPDIKYVICQFDDESYITAQSFVHRLAEIKNNTNYTLLDIRTEDLLNMKYTHPFYNTRHPILIGSHVSDSQTGLVHIAGGHGADDYVICKAHDIKITCFIDEDGLFDKSCNIPALEGLYALTQGTDRVIELLKASNLLLHTEPYSHSYPVDWRKKQPIVTRATLQWFCNVNLLKQDALDSVNSVSFIPPHSKSKLIDSITSRSEWCISRQRFWGVPILMMYDLRDNKPFMNTDLFEHIIGIIKELGPNAWFTMPLSEFLPSELKYMAPYLTKEDDTMDVWFDSGISWHILDKQADCYIEGTDQHRGWFQSSMLLSVAINKQSPTKQIITHGFVLDEQKRKMSKSVGNVIDPKSVIHGTKSNKALGVDGLRLWCASTQFTKDVQIGPRIIESTAKDLKKWRIAIKYMLGNLNDKLRYTEDYNDTSQIDKWILAEMASTHKAILSHYSGFEYHAVVHSINHFINMKLSAVYFETIKDRLYCDSIDSRRRMSSIFTLEVLLINILKWIAPITPSLAEEAYNHLNHTDSIFSLEYDILNRFDNQQLLTEFSLLLSTKSTVNRLLDAAIKSNFISNPLDAIVVLDCKDHAFNLELADLFGVSSVQFNPSRSEISILKSNKFKCIRCWRSLAPSNNSVCSRCSLVNQ
eukprot:NODE_31_length_32452_cov_0.352672.p2 type:complete len:860 gc:universal NODE_31_length_32452_cov_0.352672:8706-6127(-)